MERLGQEDIEYSLCRVVCISQDAFYRPLNPEESAKAQKGVFNFDHPDAFNNELILKTLHQILNGKICKIPNYEYVTNSRLESTTTIYPADVVLFEGILMFYQPEIRGLFHMKLFVDSDADTRLARRVMRDTRERERALEVVLNQYISLVKPAFEEFCLPTKKFADVIIPRGAENTVCRMASRPSTRGLETKSNQTLKRSTGDKVQNENDSWQSVMDKARKLVLRDSTNKTFGLERKAEDLPEGAKVKKRFAFEDITNAKEKLTLDKKNGMQKGKLVHAYNSRTLAKVGRPSKENVQPLALRPKKEEPRARPSTDITGRDPSFCDSLLSSQDTVFSQESTKSDLDDSSASETASEESPVVVKVKAKEEQLPVVLEGVEDYDTKMESDLFAVSCYANDIFTYYKQREAKFPIDKYMERQRDVSRSMRAILVDWMVEVQEVFELNHETLYLAVKILDLYLSKVVIQSDILQLIGSTAIFIACKFDMQTPPYINDFLLFCGYAYKRKELIAMEIKVLQVIGFDLGIPLSYRFLRRYARCAKVGMEDRTLTQYILEMSLMDYELLGSLDSALAASALLLSRCIKKEEHPWTPTLEHYSGNGGRVPWVVVTHCDWYNTPSGSWYLLPPILLYMSPEAGSSLLVLHSRRPLQNHKEFLFWSLSTASFTEVLKWLRESIRRKPQTSGRSHVQLFSNMTTRLPTHHSLFGSSWLPKKSFLILPNRLDVLCDFFLFPKMKFRL